MRLGIDIFSIRLQKWSAIQYLEYCRQLGVDVVHFSEPGMFESLEESYLREVKARADELGLGLEVGMGSICPTSTSFKPDKGGTAHEQASRMLRVAQTVGSPIVRCFLGNGNDRLTPAPLETHVASTVETCKAVRSLALDLGVKLAIENHAGDLQGWELKELIERAGPDYVGACIDSGNPLWVAEDPMVTLEHLAPYVVSSHVRDTRVWPHPQGAAALWCSMGDGNVGIQAWTAEFKRRCPNVPYTLEIITGMTPKILAYMEDGYWRAFPRARAAEFARFERLVRQGQPFLGSMILLGALPGAPPEYGAARKAQQLFDIERSVKHCRDILKIGRKP